jgi:hypothetical protein
LFRFGIPLTVVGHKDSHTDPRSGAAVFSSSGRLIEDCVSSAGLLCSPAYVIAATKTGRFEQNNTQKNVVTIRERGLNKYHSRFSDKPDLQQEEEINKNVPAELVEVAFWPFSDPVEEESG